MEPGAHRSKNRRIRAGRALPERLDMRDQNTLRKNFGGPSTRL